MDLFEAINNRRSIRHFKTDPVSDSDIETILEAARQAPSWANTQCWRFIVVHDPDIRNRLAAIDLDNRGLKSICQAPVVIVACAEMGKSGVYGGIRSTDKNEWYMLDVGIAVEHIALAACALGLGTVHIGLFDAKKAAAVLGIPDNYCVVEMLPLGYPDEQPTPRPRKQLSEIVFYDKFGNFAKS